MFKDIEQAWDDLYPNAKKHRKIFEQFGHAAMAAVPAGLLTWGSMALDMPTGVSVAAGAFGGLIGIPYWNGLAKEVIQNWGDELKGDELFVLGPLPVNADMLKDIAFYAIGTVIAVPLTLWLA